MKRAILVLIVTIFFISCGGNKPSKGIPRVSTPAKRQAIMLAELEKQTELLQQINTKLDSLLEKH